MSGRTAVVIDVLRATTTIVAALLAGAEEVRAAATPLEARRRYERLTALSGRSRGIPALLGGERLGLRIDGFDLGNSPLEYTPETVAGRTIIFCTTNGTRTLRRASGGVAAGPAARVLVAAFANATAVAELLAAEPADAVICCAGTRGGFSLEDTLLAGFLTDHLERLGPASPGGPFVCRDLARASAALYRGLVGEDRRRLEEVLAGADHARYLEGLGFGGDVAYAARLDTTRLVPEYRRGRVRRPATTGQSPARTGGSPSTPGSEPR